MNVWTEGNDNDLRIVNHSSLQFETFIYHWQQNIYGEKWLYVMALSPTYAELILFPR